MARSRRWWVGSVVLAAIFAAVAWWYAFEWSDPSVLRLGSDAAILGDVISARAYPEDFAGDPVQSDLGIFYTPSHVTLMARLVALVGSYVTALQILLFAQIFLTFAANVYLLRRLAPHALPMMSAMLAVLVTLPFLQLLSGEFVGFNGLSSALPRSTSWIFVPLVLAFYAEGRSVVVGRRRIPNIVATAIALGALTHVHPPSGINIFVVLWLHWLMRRAGWRAWRHALGSAAFFLVLAVAFTGPYLLLRERAVAGYGPELLAYLSHQRPWVGVIWVAKAGFVPIVVGVVAAIVFQPQQAQAENPRAPLLRDLLVLAYLVDVIGSFVHGHVTSLAYPLMRTDRFAFYLLEVLIACAAIDLVASGRSLWSPSGVVRALLVTCAALWLAGLQLPDGSRDWAVALFTRVGLLPAAISGDVASMVQGGLFGALVSVPLVLVAAAWGFGLVRRDLARGIVGSYATVLLVVVLGFRVDAYARAHLSGVSPPPSAQDVIAADEPSLQEAARFVRESTPARAGVLCLGDGFCQPFKFLSRRPGLGDWNEAWWGSGWLKNNYFEDFLRVTDRSVYVLDPAYAARLPALLRKYHLQFVVSPPWKGELLEHAPDFREVFRNEHFVVSELLNAEALSSVALDSGRMARQHRGPLDLQVAQQAFVAYEDSLVSPTLSLQRGTYVVGLTVSRGRVDLPVPLERRLSVALAGAGGAERPIDSRPLTGDATFTTKEFSVETDGPYQISFRQTDQFARTDALAFDGVNAFVNIPFHTPLELPEGTLEFWVAPTLSPADAKSSQGLATLSTQDGHAFEFLDYLLGTPPEHYLMSIWSGPKNVALHINLYNPRYGAKMWSHWAVTWKVTMDGGLHRTFYWNGDLVNENDVPAGAVSIQAGRAPVFTALRIGAMGPGMAFNGRIAEVRLYKRALDATQLRQVPVNGANALVGYWRLLGSCRQVVPDLTPNHNDGTLGADAAAGKDDPACTALDLPPRPAGVAAWLKVAVVTRVK